MSFSTNGRPFVWVPKDTLRLIETRMERQEAATAKLALLALAHCASDMRSITFEASISKLAEMSSLNRRTIERRLSDLERLGIVTIERKKLKTPHVFTLVVLKRNDATPCRNDTTPSRNDATAEQPITSVRAVASLYNREKRIENREYNIGTPTVHPTAKRISLEHSLNILKERKASLSKLVNDEIELRKDPDALNRLREVKGQIESCENQLITLSTL